MLGKRLNLGSDLLIVLELSLNSFNQVRCFKVVDIIDFFEVKFRDKPISSIFDEIRQFKKYKFLRRKKNYIIIAKEFL